MTWRVVLLEQPFVRNDGFHSNDSLYQSFKDVFIKTWFAFFMEEPIFCGPFPSTSVKNSVDLNLDLLIWAFFGREEFNLYHSLLCLLVSGWYSKIHDSSSVFTRLKKPWLLTILLRCFRFSHGKIARDS